VSRERRGEKRREREREGGVVGGDADTTNTHTRKKNKRLKEPARKDNTFSTAKRYTAQTRSLPHPTVKLTQVKSYPVS
jgi:hypothetical protein